MPAPIAPHSLCYPTSHDDVKRTLHSVSANDLKRASAPIAPPRASPIVAVEGRGRRVRNLADAARGVRNLAYARRAGRSPLVPHRDSRSRSWRVPREGFILGPPRPRRRRTNHQPRATTAAVHTATASPPPAARRRGARRRYGYGSGSGFSRQVIEIESSRRAVSGWPRVTTDRNGPSRQFAAPAHQRAAVDAYLSGTRVGLPPASGYNASNRAYPDVSAVGVSGTSQSCPIMAGLFGLLTDARLQVRAEVPLTAPTTIHRSFLRAPRGRAPEGARDTARRRLHFLVDFISSSTSFPRWIVSYTRRVTI